jgi:gamma-glutamyltranspeptidase/glutathione hydrolase
MNTAMGWFDPVLGNTASVAPGKRPLTNMSPLLVSDGDGPRLALGASGGRKIIQAVTQILMNAVDHGLDMQDAVSAPRIDSSGDEILANSRLGPAAIEGLRSAGHPVTVVDDSFTARREDGRRYSGLDPFYPAAAAGE